MVKTSILRFAVAIVFRMCTNKFDIDGSHTKKYHRYQAILISFDVEYKPLVAYGVNRIKSLFHVTKI